MVGKHNSPAYMQLSPLDSEGLGLSIPYQSTKQQSNYMLTVLGWPCDDVAESARSEVLPWFVGFQYVGVPVARLGLAIQQ